MLSRPTRSGGGERLPQARTGSITSYVWLYSALSIDGYSSATLLLRDPEAAVYELPCHLADDPRFFECVERAICRGELPVHDGFRASRREDGMLEEFVAKPGGGRRKRKGA